MPDACAPAITLDGGNLKPRFRFGNFRLPIYGGHVRAFYEAAWRPANGWIATVACALHFIVIPAASSWLVAHGKPELPKFDLAQTIALLALTLGMSGLRTAEKWWGVDTPAGQRAQPIIVETPGGAA